MSEPTFKTVRLGIIGCGHIGSELVRLVNENSEALANKGFVKLETSAIAVRDLDKPRAGFVPRQRLQADPMAVATSPEVDLVVEVAGGVEPARSWVEAALHAGKRVVTANKAMMAEYGGDLLSLAARLALPLRYEASVGGGIPVLRAIESGLTGTRIDEIAGVINGTTNYILTQMEEQDWDFKQALAEAQRLGYAESDPTLDIDGTDAAQKLVILTGLAFGVEVPLETFPIGGITEITQEHITEARRRGQSIRLVARARRSSDASKPPALTVRPEHLPTNHSLARLSGVTNAVELIGDPLGAVVLAGPGAGPGPTATAVLADVLDAARPGAFVSRTWREFGPQAFGEKTHRSSRRYRTEVGG